MKVAHFSAKKYDHGFFTNAFTSHDIGIEFFEARLSPKTAGLASGFDAVCAFVNDDLSKETIDVLADLGIKLIALRSAGFNHVNLAAAAKKNIAVVRVPEYSPHAVAEHTIALLMGVNRKIYRAYNRVREGNFELDGLIGFDLNGKTVGVVGAGKIGMVTVGILLGFGCEVLISDPALEPGPHKSGAKVMTFDEVLSHSDILSLHCPLTPATHHLICEETLCKTKKGVIIVNTSRGGLIDTNAVIGGLKSEHIGALAIDVYEEEGDLFFSDLSNFVMKDDVFARLLTFPNVLVTGHQAFFTREAMIAIAGTTASNITQFFKTGACENSVGLNLVSEKA